MKIIKLISLYLGVLSHAVSGQISNSGIFRIIELHTDTLVFRSNTHFVNFNDERHLYFFYDDDNEVAEIVLRLQTGNSVHISWVTLLAWK